MERQRRVSLDCRIQFLYLRLPHLHWDENEDHERDPDREADEPRLPVPVEPVRKPVVVIIIVLVVLILRKVIQSDVVDCDGGGNYSTRGPGAMSMLLCCCIQNRNSRHAAHEPYPLEALLVVARSLAGDGRNARGPDIWLVLVALYFS